MQLEILKKSSLAIIVSMAMALTACGGGGSSGGSDPQPSTNEITITSLNSDTNASSLNTLGCFNQSGDESKCGLIMYQVIPATYANGGDADGWGKGWGPSKYKGTLGGVAQHIDYIKDLGVNAIWITPVFKTNPTESDVATYKTDASGYYASTFSEIEPKIGGSYYLHDFIDKTHKAGMKVILDMVLGHVKSNFSTSELTTGTSVNCIDMGGNLKPLSAPQACVDWTDARSTSETYFKHLLAELKTNYGVDGWRFDQAYQVPAASWNKVMEGDSSYTVAEIWDGDGSAIKTALNSSLDSAFAFPLRYAVMKVMASQEDTNNGYGIAPTEIEGYGYKNLAKYAVAGKMLNMFTDNHDLVRFGDLIQRAGYTSDGSNAEVVADETYRLRHKLGYTFLAQYSGPITIYYNQEIGDQVPNFSKKLSSCGTDTAFCDDHVSRTDAVYSETGLTDGQKDLRNTLKQLLVVRKDHKSLWMGSRYHIYSDANVYVDLKVNKSANDRVLYVMNASTNDFKLSFGADQVSQLCSKAGFENCGITLKLTNLLDSSDTVILGTDSISLSKLNSKLYLIEQ